uniref:Protein arginine N-methyltransferase 5 n=1 Tax=Kwoniella bestiolae CBS 10118 TaxID=1296100 RepID=A0A1B9GAF4_9TREE|nr:protein arginine N-methyltransferase 5 [Kwoniella bestiolae CBS 10118]OCF27994.1 protein arginine N-methyltransferase 5 [Kwoniella bestiolae CBS 10118]
MPRHPIAFSLPSPAPSLPTTPRPNPSPLQQTISNTLSSTDYDLVALPLTNTAWQDRWERLCLRPVEEDEDLTPEQLAERDREREKVDLEADIWRRDGGLRRDEVNVSRLEESQAVITTAAEWLELDSPDEGIRFDSEIALRSEMAQALYLSLPVLIIPAPQLINRAFLPSYARAISNLLHMGGSSAFTQISIRIPISDPMINQANNTNTTSNPQNLRIASGASSTMSAKSTAGATGDPSSTWEMWDCIRTLCGYHPRLSVTLDLTNPLPPSVGALARWTAEPVKYIWLPAGSFIPNAKGYPVLSKACQAFLRGMSKQNPTYVLHGTSMQKHSAGGPNAYLQYVRHITSQPPTPNGLPPSADEFTSGYADYLQAPLQPLMDDLGSATYDIFERDPVKYRQYEEAITLALSDLPANKTHVVTVVGAGRGPLVACTLRALTRANRQANVYAVEKNPNAFITLQERKAIEWGDQVEIFFGDMRNVEVPEKCDIMVSELLGSFGDNELSPECLDGAMRFLKPTGISIPTSYTAHVAPISSSKLFHDVHQPTRPAGATETPYVVMMSQVNLISGDGGGVSGRCGEKVQQCWQFEHPRRDLILDASGAPLTNTHNTRSARHIFHIPHAATLHGLAGYFEAHLYSNVGLSIHPDNAHRVSPDMFSWFPLYFPLKEALYLPSGSELEVNLWRLCDSRGRKIWYEWSVESYLSVSQNLPTSAGLTPNGSRHVSSSGALGGQPSPLMDAPFSPGFSSSNSSQNQMGDLNRIKIGQTSLHNPAGVHSWVGL